MTSDTKELHIRFHGRVLEQLGIQTYQRPVNALAELIANSWDADANSVEMSVPPSATAGAVITVQDDGNGMTFRECQDRYLNVGWNRRADDPAARSPAGRPVLGRKGIGKFAGFGIAQVIEVRTVSKETGELTTFGLNLTELLSGEYASTESKPVSVIEYQGPDAERRMRHGTTVTLKSLKLKRGIPGEQLRNSMARRYLLHQMHEDFTVKVNGLPLPVGEPHGVQYSFPRDYREEEKPSSLAGIDGSGWGMERLSGGRTIKWRVLFLQETLNEEELRGISVFAHGKVAQAPFLFLLAGGLGGQHGVEYMTGQVEADYLDELPEDLISTERQRVNWEHDESEPLLKWGQARVKDLLRLWHDRRGETKAKAIEDKLVGFSGRLDRLQPRESRTVRTAIRKLAMIPTLSEERFEELGDAVLTAWEHGRLKELISEIADSENLSSDDLLGVLVEAQVLTALNTAEAVKTKLLTVGGLKVRVARRELESAVRDYIASNPWLISPRWETFRVERSVRKLLEDAAATAKLEGPEWEGRVDLALSGGSDLLVVEFMRPGLVLDWDHISRFEKYVRTIRTRTKANTAGPQWQVTGYVVADGLTRSAEVLDKIQNMDREGMFAMDWDTLFSRAVDQWREFLGILSSRAGDDERMRTLLEDR